MKSISFLGILLSLFLVISCSHIEKRKVPLPATPVAFSAFNSAHENRAKRLSPLSGKLLLGIESPTESVRGPGLLLSETGPERLRLEIRDPLGKIQLLIILKDTEFSAYYPGQATVYTDSSAGSAYLSRHFGIGMSLKDLQRLALGLLPAGATLDSKQWEWDEDEGAYRTGGKLGGQGFRAWVDPQLLSLRRLTWGNFSAEFSDHQNCCGKSGEATALARSVAITRSGSHTARVELDWKRVDQPEKVPEVSAYAVDLPPGTKHQKIK